MNCVTPEACRRARQRLGWSRLDLAAASGLTGQTIENFETGRHSPRPRTAVAILRAFRAHGIDLAASGDVPASAAG